MQQECEQRLTELTDNHQEVLATYHEFVALLKDKESTDLARILDGISFAAEKHKEQKRKGIAATPYIIHPIGVAKILWEEGQVYDTDVLIAALLHDTIEDTNTTAAEIEKHFGKKVCGIIKEVTDNKSLPKAQRKALQIINASKKSVGAKLVKLADKLSNLRDLEKSAPVDWESERLNAYFVWAEKVVKGLRGTNSNLEAALDKVFVDHVSK